MKEEINLICDQMCWHEKDQCYYYLEVYELFYKVYSITFRRKFMYMNEIIDEKKIEEILKFLKENERKID